MAAITKAELLEVINDMPMDANMEEILFCHILNSRIRYDFRAEQMKTVLENRKRFAKLNGSMIESKIYDDCLAILNKEFFELTLTDDINIHMLIHEIRDKIVKKICPIDDRIRGTRLHMLEMKKAGEIATIIESLCYKMFSHGFNYYEEGLISIKYDNNN